MTTSYRHNVVRRIRVSMVSVLVCLFAGTALAQSAGDKLALFDFVTFDGQTVKAEELKGRPVLLYFWASWCPTCVSEMPLLRKTYAKYKDKGFEILAVSFREEPAKSISFFKRYGFEFPGGPINAAYTAAFPTLRGTPTWFLMDRDGVIRMMVSGKPDVRWELEKALAPLL